MPASETIEFAAWELVFEDGRRMCLRFGLSQSSTLLVIRHASVAIPNGITPFGDPDYRVVDVEKLVAINMEVEKSTFDPLDLGGLGKLPPKEDE